MPTPGAFAGGTSAKGGPVKGKKGEGGAGSASGSRKRAREGDVVSLVPSVLLSCGFIFNY